MFSKGEYVVYGTNGICLVEDIGPMRNSEESDRDFYVLRPKNSANSVLYVPVDNETLCNKMRYVFTSGQLNEILSSVKDSRLEWIDDRKTRMVVFRELLHGGEFRNLVLLAQCVYTKQLQLSAVGKRVSDADDGMYRSAERMVTDEFMWAFQKNKSEVLEYICNFLK